MESLYNQISHRKNVYLHPARAAHREAFHLIGLKVLLVYPSESASGSRSKVHRFHSRSREFAYLHVTHTAQAATETILSDSRNTPGANEYGRKYLLHSGTASSSSAPPQSDESDRTYDSSPTPVSAESHSSYCQSRHSLPAFPRCVPESAFSAHAWILTDTADPQMQGSSHECPAKKTPDIAKEESAAALQNQPPYTDGRPQVSLTSVLKYSVYHNIVSFEVLHELSLRTDQMNNTFYFSYLLFTTLPPDNACPTPAGSASSYP